MRKKTFIFILVGLIASFTIYIVINDDHMNTPDRKSPPKQTEKKTDDEKENDIEETQPDEHIKEEDPITEQVKNFITGAIQSTIDFFLNRDLWVVAMGDSLTQGVGDETDQGGYVGILDQMIHTNEQKTNVTFENFGKRGDRTDQLLVRLDEEDIQQSITQAHIILMTIGANDIMEVFKQNLTHLTIEPFQEERLHFEQRLQQIFTKIRDLNSDAHIYLLGIYNPFAQYFQHIEELELIVNRWNRTSQQITEQFDHATFIPIKDLFEDTQIHLFAEDNFHPNRQGYERMAGRVLEYLTEQEE